MFAKHKFCLSDAAVELAVEVGGVVLGEDIDFDVGVGAVVFDLPADILEPEGVFGLCGDGAIGECVARPDSDDAAPCSFADEGAEVHEFEAV